MNPWVRLVPPRLLTRSLSALADHTEALERLQTTPKPLYFRHCSTVVVACHVSLTLTALGLLASPAEAQTQARLPTTANAAAPSPGAHDEASPAEPEAYKDRIIEGLPPAADDGLNAAPYNRAGWPRFLRVETRLGTQPFDAERSTQTALALYGLIDTPNHGALSADGAYTPRSGNGTLTVRQRGLPLEGGWVGNHEAGVISSPATDLSRLPGRVYLPSATLLGASGEWRQSGQGLTVIASSGQPGQLESLPASGFSGQGGRRQTIGAQWRPDGSTDATFSPTLPGWTLAVQHENARDLSGLLQTTQTTDNAQSNTLRTDASANLFAARHETENRRVQVNALTGTAEIPASATSATVAPSANGFWVDSEWDEGPRTHGLSLYRLDSGLNWAGQAMPNDLQGLTVSSAWRTRQWSAEGSVDWLRSISGERAAGTYASGSARWRIDRKNTLGAGASVRRFDGNAWSSYGDWRFENGWGTSGLRLELAGGDSDQTSSQSLIYDQDWAVSQGWSVSTSFGLGTERETLDGGDTLSDRFWNAAASVSAPLGSRASLRGTASTEQSQLGRRRHALTLGGNWRVDPRWTLEANFNRSIGQSTTTSSLDPLAPIVTNTSTNNDRSYYLVLRYEFEAGSRSVPLGGRPFEGGGFIEGVVYYDTNRSGTQEASETGVPNVTVFIDNRYGVRTDAQGRFSFPLVGTGPRTVTLRNETLPLPWNVVNEGQTRVDVRLRERTRLSLPVQRSE
jgi:hypothetical protein